MEGNAENMAPQTPNEPKRNELHSRFHTSFDTWHKSAGSRMSQEEEERVLGIREAVIKNPELAKRYLEETRDKSSWIYQELMEHPEISAIFRELAIWGL